MKWVSRQGSICHSKCYHESIEACNGQKEYQATSNLLIK